MVGQGNVVGQGKLPPNSSTLGSFWQTFKTAVVSGNQETVASLSQFPIGMSYGIKSIHSKTELYQRYREVFKQQSDAAQCFTKKQPVVDRANQRRFSVACPDKAGNEVVVYEFERTRTGWKFVRLDNTNE
jgi:hypothetical protein